MTATSLLLQANTPSSASKNVIEMRGISTRFGDHVVHENLDLDVKVGEIFAIVGGSGSGKSSLLREMIMLNQANAGTINGSPMPNTSKKVPSRGGATSPSAANVSLSP